MPIRVYIPEVFIALNKEIAHHPLLVQRIQKHPVNEPELAIAEVAAYCLVQVDGTFDESDLAKLAALCLDRLLTLRPKPALFLPKEEDWSKKYDQIKAELDKKNRRNL